jgi:hypothetical protein
MKTKDRNFWIWEERRRIRKRKISKRRGMKDEGQDKYKNEIRERMREKDKTNKAMEGKKKRTSIRKHKSQNVDARQEKVIESNKEKNKSGEK